MASVPSVGPWATIKSPARIVSDCPDDMRYAHITQVGVSGPEGDRVMGVGAVRLMLSSGDSVSVGLPTDVDAEIRKGRCPACGAKTLRTQRSESDVLADLPSC